MSTAADGARTPHPSEPTPRAGPLSDVRVVELAGIGPAPFAGMILREMGADVIRVDRLDPEPRAAAPPGADLLNRGKRSVVLDLKHPDAVAAVLDLAATSDVLIEGFRPGVAERLGLGPDAVRQRNPALVYGRMTGWGQDGPLAGSVGHDVDYVAVTGALAAIGSDGGPPQIPLNVVGDMGGGATYLVMGVLAAVMEARRTGEGRIVDAAIVDGVSHLLGVVHTLRGAGRWEDRRGRNLLDGGVPYYAVYETSDGEFMAVGALEQRFYAELLRILAPDLDAAQQDDREQWPTVRETLGTAFLARTQAEWTAVFDGSDACVAPVLSLGAAVDHPHVAARRSLVVHDGVVQAMPAPRFSGLEHPGPLVAVEPGHDTRAVLAEIGREDLLDSGAAFGS